jgi:hypothetical protein
MNIVIDRRPAAELTDTEVVAYLFQELRASQYRALRQVRSAMVRMFPDLAPDRQSACLRQLARALS